MAYRVLVVEDQEMPRQLFEIFINSSEEFKHVGSVANAGLALSMCKIHLLVFTHGQCQTCIVHV